MTPGSHAYTATFVPTDATTYTGSVSPSRTLSVAADRDDDRPDARRPAAASRSSSRRRSPARAACPPAAWSSARAARSSARWLVDRRLRGARPGRRRAGAHTYTATFVPTDPATYAGSASHEPVGDRRPDRDRDRAHGRPGEPRRSGCEASLDSDAAGRIVFREGGTVVGQVTLADKAAVLTLADVAPGAHTYTATFEPTRPGDVRRLRLTGPHRHGQGPHDDRPDGPRGRTLRHPRRHRHRCRLACGRRRLPDGDDVVGTVAVDCRHRDAHADGCHPGQPRLPGDLRARELRRTVAGSVSAVRSTTVAAIATTTALSTAVDGDDRSPSTPRSPAPAARPRARWSSATAARWSARHDRARRRCLDDGHRRHPRRPRLPRLLHPGRPGRLRLLEHGPAVRAGRSGRHRHRPDRDSRQAHRLLRQPRSPRRTRPRPAQSSSARARRSSAPPISPNGVSHFELTGVEPGLHTYTATYVPARADDPRRLDVVRAQRHCHGDRPDGHRVGAHGHPPGRGRSRRAVRRKARWSSARAPRSSAPSPSRTVRRRRP